MKTFKDLASGRRLDPDTEHQILGMYHDNSRSVAEMAAVLGTSIGSIYRVLERNGLKPSRQKKPEGHALIDSYNKWGLKPAKIAELTGYSTRQVYNVLRGMKVND